ncbi:MAG: hypothetical protein IIB09_01250 [Bacteroidetes bacterium]|nr:hypothetical protein [Bacteroidota bacterium]
MIAAGRGPGTDTSRSLSAYDYAVTMATTPGFTKDEINALREAELDKTKEPHANPNPTMLNSAAKTVPTKARPAKMRTG